MPTSVSPRPGVGVAERARTGPWPAVAALLVAVCGAAYGLTLAPGITWANNGLDSAELIAAAIVGGVAHPSGYPTYLMLARAAATLLPGDPALAVTLLSPLAATLAALVLGDTARRCCGADEPWASSAGLLAGLSLAFAPLFWAQALIAEVYGLTALFAALLLRATLVVNREAEQLNHRGRGGRAEPNFGRAVLTGLLAGVGLGTHLTLLPVVLLWLFGDTLYARSARRTIGALAGVAAGLLVYLYLPLAARSGPPINWGGADSWDGFWWLVSGQLYSGMAFGLPREDLLPRLAAWAPLAGQQLGWLGLALAALGLVGGGKACGPLRFAPLALAAVAALFALGYNSFDAQVYLIPAVMAAALYAGLGAGLALGWLAERQPRLAAPLALVLVVASVWSAPHTAASVDASGDDRALAYADAILAQAPPGAVVITNDDRNSFPLWYAHFARGRRPDLLVVTDPLLDFPWYRRSLRDAYPALGLPVASRAAVEAALHAHGPHCVAQAEPLPALHCTTP